MVTLNSNGAYWQARWIDSAGRPVVKSLGPKSGLTRKQALRRCADLAVEHAIAPGKKDVREAPTLRAWTDEYLKLIESTHADGTVTLTRDTIRYLLERFGESVTLDRIKPADAEDFAAWLAGKGLGRATVCRHVRTMKTMWRRAIRRRRVGEDPWADLKSTPPKRKKDIPNLDDAGVARIIEACPTPAWKALFAFCAWGGCRRGEALRIRWGDIQHDRNRFYVRLPDGEKDGDSKHAERFTLLCPQLSALTTELQEQAEPGSKGPCHGISLNNLHRQARAIIIRAGFLPWEDPFHALRRWRVSTWKLKYPAPVVNEWLGHTEDVSEGHYFGVRDEVFGLEAELAKLRAQVQQLEQEKAR